MNVRGWGNRRSALCRLPIDDPEYTAHRAPHLLDAASDSRDIVVPFGRYRILDIPVTEAFDRVGEITQARPDPPAQPQTAHQSGQYGENHARDCGPDAVAGRGLGVCAALAG